MSKNEINYPKISIITVSYNAIKTIEQTILSVINQEYKNIEYIIIDGVSIDGTVDIIKKYEDKIAYWVSEPDTGIYDAMNKGVSKVTGEYIQFLGADDCLCELTTIEQVVDSISGNQGIDIISGTVWTVNEKTKMQRLWKNDVNDEKIKKGYLIHHQGMFVRKEILIKYPFNQEYRIVSDYEFILKTYFDKEIKYKYILLPIAFYSMEGISATDNSRILEQIDVMEKFQLDENIINERKAELTSKTYKIKVGLKFILKKIFSNIKIWNYIEMKRGWSLHRCQMPKCRWCKNSK